MLNVAMYSEEKLKIPAGGLARLPFTSTTATSTLLGWRLYPYTFSVAGRSLGDSRRSTAYGSTEQKWGMGGGASWPLKWARMTWSSSLKRAARKSAPHFASMPTALTLRLMRLWTWLASVDWPWVTMSASRARRVCDH